MQVSEADVLLVTATKVERQAVVDAFKRSTRQTARLESRDGKIYHFLGEVNQTRVWLVGSEMGAVGLGAAQQTTQKAISALRPKAVIMVGIAFGADETKQKIGEILVSTSLRLYEAQRIGDERTIARGARPDASPWLLDSFRSAELSWKRVKVDFGLLLTGEKLIDNSKFRENLRKFEPEAIGGEMEGAGLYTACNDAKVDWILAKAICDWADGRKETGKSENQASAAKNAADFVLHVLESVSLKAKRPGGSEISPVEDTSRKRLIFTIMGFLSFGLFALALILWRLWYADKPLRPSARENISVMQNFTNSPGAVAQSMVNSPGSTQITTIQERNLFRPLDAKIEERLGVELDKLKAKYERSQIRIQVEVEANSSERQKVAETLGRLLSSKGLGGYASGTYIGRFPNAPITLFYGTENSEIAKDFRAAVSGFITGEIRFEPLISWPSNFLRFYLNGTALFSEDGRVTFQ